MASSGQKVAGQDLLGGGSDTSAKVVGLADVNLARPHALSHTRLSGGTEQWELRLRGHARDWRSFRGQVRNGAGHGKRSRCAETTILADICFLSNWSLHFCPSRLLCFVVAKALETAQELQKYTAEASEACETDPELDISFPFISLQMRVGASLEPRESGTFLPREPCPRSARCISSHDHARCLKAEQEYALPTKRTTPRFCNWAMSRFLEIRLCTPHLVSDNCTRSNQ